MKDSKHTISYGNDISITTLHQPDSEDYATTIWPCSLVLTEYLHQNPDIIRNKTVLEISSGSSIPGIYSSYYASKAYLTDHPVALERIKAVLSLNPQRNINVLPLEWANLSHSNVVVQEINHPVVILCSDVLYDAELYEDFVVTLSHLLDNLESVCYMTYERRSVKRQFEHLFDHWGMKLEEMDFEFDDGVVNERVMPRLYMTFYDVLLYKITK